MIRNNLKINESGRKYFLTDFSLNCFKNPTLEYVLKLYWPLVATNNVDVYPIGIFSSVNCSAHFISE